MPCAALPRGGRVTLIFPASPPASFTPVNAKTHVPPFNDATDNNPCGKAIVATVNAVDVSAQNLCLGHYGMANGLAAVKGAITFGA
jgi:peroxiredoxin